MLLRVTNWFIDPDLEMWVSDDRLIDPSAVVCLYSYEEDYTMVELKGGHTVTLMGDDPGIVAMELGIGIVKVE